MSITESVSVTTAKRQYGEETVAVVSDCEGEELDASSWTDEQIEWYLNKRGLQWNAELWAWLLD